ncbi:hypothetical protein [Hamadaea tsunoensis]|uniref:hypothetical protein n=1 Tax=Hamadaea tsunoensis TaxID=53368 RepID=UPI00048A1A9B|nr:hypothetical protein [Hamadaea tsunoensis]
MTHVELSLSPSVTPDWRPPVSIPAELDRWVRAVVESGESALVIDASATIIATTPSCATLLGLPEPWAGERLPDALHLIDFTAAGSELPDAERELIPPLLAVASGRLARGLIRVRAEEQAIEPRTLDAIATPLHAEGVAVGSLTFFCEI